MFGLISNFTNRNNHKTLEYEDDFKTKGMTFIISLDIKHSSCAV